MNQQFSTNTLSGNNEVGKIAISAGGVTAVVVGVSVFAAEAAIILATGEAAAIGLAGYGIYKYLSNEKGKGE
jgi:hypothetical protein